MLGGTDALVYLVGTGESTQLRLLVEPDASGQRVGVLRYSLFYD